MKNIIYIILLLFFFSCKLLVNPNDESDVIENETATDEQFNYEMTREVHINLETGYSNIPVTISYGDTVHYQGVSNNNGMIKTSFTIPEYYEYLELSTDYIGLLSYAKVAIFQESMRFNYSSPLDSLYDEDDADLSSPQRTSSSAGSNLYKTLGTWNYYGKPDYLITSDTISQSLLNQINQSLPEKQPVPEYHSHYLDDTAEKDLHLVENADVFVTFVHEGAGYRNALGFFTYDTAAGPPSSVTDDEITLIFPNVSYLGGGGLLSSGDKVNIGSFEAGTSIGWVIIANGYKRWGNSVSSGLNKFYSVDALNADAPGHKQHVVLLDYSDESLFILSFEDLKRPYGDNDFNDAVFYVTANPITAINSAGIVNTDDEAPEADSDNDGIVDSSDPEPFNSSVVSHLYTPGENTNGTLAFEDLWPFQGDYDFNDLVIDYKFRESLNSDGKIVAIQCEFTIKGILASMHNGFALELGIEPEDIQSVSGGEYSRGYTVRGTNGAEERQELAVIVIFEDANEHYDPDGPEQMIVIDIDLTRAVTRSELGYAPYNPFIMSNGERGREVHLPGKKQTDLAHYEYFGSNDDESILGTGQMYKTSDNRPWALNLPVSFHYPFDDVHITRAYNFFEQWVDTDGSSFSDWYVDQSGYRNSTYLFTFY